MAIFATSRILFISSQFVICIAPMDRVRGADDGAELRGYYRLRAGLQECGWLVVTFMHDDLGYFDDETCRLEPIDILRPKSVTYARGAE